VTTAVGFGGLVLSFHPGLRSIGVLAVIGFATTLLAALVFVPALLQWMEDTDVVSGNPSNTDGRSGETDLGETTEEVAFRSTGE
jgi:uncharacterized membrane protein YdfJ with MMPL/SSD domain